jgi:hypothetical protein
MFLKNKTNAGLIKFKKMNFFLPFIKTIIIFSSKYSDKGTVLCTGFMCGPMATKKEERKQQPNERQEADFFVAKLHTNPLLTMVKSKNTILVLTIERKAFFVRKKTVLKKRNTWKVVPNQ